MQTQQTNNAVQTAQNKIAEIQQAIAGGNKKLTAADLAEARNDLEFAELRQQAAIIAEEKANLARRTARTREFEKRLKAIADDTTLPDAKRRFEKSLLDYIATAEKHNKALYEIQADLANEGLQPNGSNSVGVPVGVEYPSTGAHQPFIIGEAQAYFTDIRKPTHEFLDSNLTPGV